MFNLDVLNMAFATSSFVETEKAVLSEIVEKISHLSTNKMPEDGQN